VRAGILPGPAHRDRRPELGIRVSGATLPVISRVTSRRDITGLAGAGSLKRTHGGALLPGALVVTMDPPRLRSVPGEPMSCDLDDPETFFAGGMPSGAPSWRRRVHGRPGPGARPISRAARSRRIRRPPPTRSAPPFSRRPRNRQIRRAGCLASARNRRFGAPAQTGFCLQAQKLAGCTHGSGAIRAVA
jgi:hypothetical protein